MGCNFPCVVTCGVAIVTKDDWCILQAQKAILDTELDIIAKGNEGGDTSDLRKKVAELKREVQLQNSNSFQLQYSDSFP